MPKCTACPNTQCPFRSSEVKISGFPLVVIGCKISYRGKQIFDLSWLPEGKAIMRLRESQVKKARLQFKNDQLAS